MRRLFTTAALAALAACGGGGDGGTVNPPAVGGFTFTLSQATLSVVQGGIGNLTANIARTGTFTGTVDLSVENAPAGVTASFAPPSVAGGSTASTLTLTVGGTVVPGAYTLTIRGRGTGVPDQTTQVALTVTAAPSIALALTPTTGTVVQGGSTAITTTLTRTNFTGAVTLAVTGAPTGVSTTIATNGDAGTITVNAGAAATVGTHTLTLTATGTGVASATAAFTLTVTSAPAGSIAVALSAAAATVNQGANTAFTVNITRSNFAGDVSVALTGVPAGVTPTVTTSPTAGNSVQVQLAVGAATVPAFYSISVTASATGVANATAAFALTVAAAPAIVIATTPTAASVQQGNSTNFTVNIARTNFAQNVTLAVSGAPAGVSTSVAASPTVGNTATVSVNVGASSAPGVYPLTVTGSGSGIANATATFALTVTPAPVGSGNVSWDFNNCSANERPIWVAVQNANGAWQQVLGNNNTFGFTINTLGGVAWVAQNGADDFTLQIAYGVVGDLQGRGSAPCGEVGGTKTLTGTVAGLSPTGSALVTLGSAFSNPPPTFATPNFTLNNVADGPQDMVASRSTINLTTFASTVDKFVLRRNQNIHNGGALALIDFGGAEAFDPAAPAVTITNGAAGEVLAASSVFITANRAFGTLGAGSLSAGVGTYPAIPTARLVAGDLHYLTGTATLFGAGGAGSARNVTKVFRDAVAQTLNLGPSLASPSITTVANVGYHRPRVVLPRQAQYATYWAIGYGQSGASSRAASISMTSAYLPTGDFDHTMPDFSGVAGWNNHWGLRTTGTTTYSLNASGWTLGGSSLGAPILEGTEILTAVRIGSYTP